MTHHSHRTGCSKLLRPQQMDDRRRYQRFEKHGLMARVGNVLYDVQDVSVGGVRLAEAELAVGTKVSMTLFARDGNNLDLSHSILTHGEVVGRVGAAVRIRFVSMSYTLAKFLIQHLARRNGLQPYIFK